MLYSSQARNQGHTDNGYIRKWLTPCLGTFSIGLLQLPSVVLAKPSQPVKESAIAEITQSVTRQTKIAEKEGSLDRGRLGQYDIRTRAAITVQVINGDQKGSGIIIKDRQKRLWIATNRHVVGESSYVCIAFSDGRILPGNVFQSKDFDYDISFVSVSRLRKDELFAKPDFKFDTTSVNPVVATGYREDTDVYLETPGVTVPILRGEKLGSGYSLTYSNQVEKGMSGGGIFSDNDRVIGINALHSDPLWPGDWYDSTGRKVRGSLGKKLDAVSVGIAIHKVYSALDHLEEKSTSRRATTTCAVKKGYYKK